MKATIVKLTEKAALVAVSKGLALGNGQIGYCAAPAGAKVGDDISELFFAEGTPVLSEMIDSEGEVMTTTTGQALHQWVWL